MNFTEQQMLDNLAALVEAVNKAKPTGAKGIYIRRITLTSTMAPGIRLDAMAATALKSSNA